MYTWNEKRAFFSCFVICTLRSGLINPVYASQGTTNSAVAVIVDGQPVMVPNSRGKVTTPSVVSFKKRASDKASAKGGGGGGGLARIAIGEAAVARIASHPRNTYSSVKRIVGRTKKEAKEAGVGLGALNVDQVRAAD